MSGPISGLNTLFTGAKGWLLAGTAAVVVAGGAGFGVWQAIVNNGPKLEVVQRSASTAMTGGTTSVLVACKDHETLLSGGYSAPGAIVTRSDVLGTNTWQVEARGQNGGTLTAYAVCINAELPVATSGAYKTTFAYHDRADKQPRAAASADPTWSDMTLDGTFAAAPRWPGGELHASCPASYTATAIGFYLDTYNKGIGGDPVPFFAAAPGSGAGGTSWTAALNNGASLSGENFTSDDGADSHVLVTKTLINRYHQTTRAYNEIAHVRPICIGGLNSVTVATKTVNAGKNATTLDSVKCPGGKLLLGGGFTYPDFFSISDGQGVQIIPFADDGWLYADRSAPALDQPSGQPATSWYVHGINQQQNSAYANSIGDAFTTGSDGSTATAVFMASGGFAGSTLRGFPIPSQQRLTLSALCGRSSASATTPGGGQVTPPTPPTDTPAPTATPSPAATATPQPTATTAAQPTATATATPAPVLSVSPQQMTADCAAGTWPQTIQVVNTGGGTLHWQVGQVPQGITASPSNGSVSAGNSQTVTLSGTYPQPPQQITIQFVGDGGQANVTVYCGSLIH